MQDFGARDEVLQRVLKSQPGGRAAAMTGAGAPAAGATQAAAGNAPARSATSAPQLRTVAPGARRERNDG